MPLTSAIDSLDLALTKRRAGKAEINLVKKSDHRENKQTVAKASESIIAEPYKKAVRSASQAYL
jgi:hypothetical protein